MSYNSNLDFDKVLKTAFTEDLKSELQSLPTEEELSKAYKFSKEFMRKIQHLLKNKKRKSRITVYVKKAAIIVFTIIGIGTSVILVSPKVRAEVKNIMMKWLSDFVEFKSTNTGQQYNFKDFSFSINYIPDGYELIDTLETSTIRVNKYKSSTSEKLEFKISVFLNNGAHTTLVDNEKRTVEKIKINSLEGYLFKTKETGDYNIIIFYSEEFRINLIGTISYEELIKIAENIKIK